MYSHELIYSSHGVPTYYFTTSLPKTGFAPLWIYAAHYVVPTSDAPNKRLSNSISQ